MTAKLLPGILGAALCAASTFAAPLPGPTGFVVSFSGRGTDYVIHHGNRDEPVEFGRPLYPGDVVALKGAGGHIVLSVGGSLPVVDGASGPYVVHKGWRVLPTRLRNLLAMIGSAFARDAAADELPGAPAGARGPDALPPPLALGIDGIADGSAHIAAGPRRFGVAWRGGVAPYAVAVRAPDGRTVVNVMDLKHCELAIASHPISFVPGAYTVEIRDATGRSVVGHFKVDDSLPAVPEDLFPPDTDDDVKTLLAAMWRAHEGPRALRYEAYLELLALIGDPKLDDTVENQIGYLKHVSH
ncbi:MAG: hypothetical protein JSR60_13765 [Proteobacteria bacterium]|nr:hypothetical protein [Pseudomonadota bacterium]